MMDRTHVMGVLYEKIERLLPRVLGELCIYGDAATETYFV